MRNVECFDWITSKDHQRLQFHYAQKKVVSKLKFIKKPQQIVHFLFKWYKKFSCWWLYMQVFFLYIHEKLKKSYPLFGITFKIFLSKNLIWLSQCTDTDQLEEGLTTIKHFLILKSGWNWSKIPSRLENSELPRKFDNV